MDYDWLNFRSTDRIEKSTYFIKEASLDCLRACLWLEEQLHHSYFTRQVVCLIRFTAVSFDRLIEPHVINVTTIVDGITLEGDIGGWWGWGGGGGVTQYRNTVRKNC